MVDGVGIRLRPVVTSRVNEAESMSEAVNVKYGDDWPRVTVILRQIISNLSYSNINYLFEKRFGEKNKCLERSTDQTGASLTGLTTIVTVYSGVR